MTAEALAAWEAYRMLSTPMPAEMLGDAPLRNAWIDGRAFGLVEGAMLVARPEGEAYAKGIQAGRVEERARCIQICTSNRDEWNTEGDGWFCADQILLEIKAG
jgi:hypothetical protein